MAELYTVQLQGAAVLTLERAVVAWREVERVYRRGETPRPLARVVFEITVSAVVRATGGQSGMLTALNTTLANYLEKRVGPTYLKILDRTGAPVPEIGAIDLSAAAWDALEISDIVIPPRSTEDPAQWRSHVAVTFVLQAEKVFPDADGVCELDVTENSEGADEAGNRTRKRVTELRIARASSTTVASLASDHALAAPVGWRRVAPTNTTSGVSIEYLDGDLKKWARLTSEVTEGAAGVNQPKNSGKAINELEEREDPARGLMIRTTRAELEGQDAQSWVLGKEPTDSVGTFAYDKAGPAAKGQWEVRAPLRPPTVGKVTKRRWTRTLNGGGRRVSAAEIAGNTKPVVRIGPRAAYELLEAVDVFALGAVTLADIPLPSGPPPSELWQETQPLRSQGLPEVQDPGRVVGQHVIRRQATRRWTWLGDGDPLDNAMFGKWLMNEATSEETP